MIHDFYLFTLVVYSIIFLAFFSFPYRRDAISSAVITRLLGMRFLIRPNISTY